MDQPKMIARMDTTFGQRIKLVIRRTGLSNNEIAKLVGVLPSWVSALTHDHRLPSISSIAKFLDCFPDIDARWLICGKGEEPKQSLDSLIALHEKRLSAIEQQLKEMMQ